MFKVLIVRNHTIFYMGKKLQFQIVIRTRPIDGGDRGDEEVHRLLCRVRQVRAANPRQLVRTLQLLLEALRERERPVHGHRCAHQV